jgi:cell division protease FtsH
VTKQYRRSNLSFALLALVILLCVSWLWQADMREEQISYSEVRQLFLQEKVEAFSIDSGGVLTMQLRQAVDGSEVVRYQLYDFQLFYDDFNDLVQEQYAKGVLTAYDYPDPESTNWLALLLPYVLVAAALAVFWYFMMARAQGGMGPDKMAKFGSARTRTLTDKDKKVTFEDVAGPTRRRKNSRRSWSF